jgi:hypothetical protein
MNLGYILGDSIPLAFEVLTAYSDESRENTAGVYRDTIAIALDYCCPWEPQRGGALVMSRTYRFSLSYCKGGFKTT